MKHLSQRRKPTAPTPQLRTATSPDLPPASLVDLTDSVRQLWMTRVSQCMYDTYLGTPLCKLPEDLRVYEHLLEIASPQVIIEIGAYGGGSALWFRDRLRTLERYGRVTDPLVVSVELESTQTAKALDAVDPDWRSSIHLVGGDVCDPATAARVAEIVPPGASAMVIEDSAHVYETTSAALTHFSRFVQPGGYFVVEDGCVDVEQLRLEDQWPRGVLPALHDWLATDDGGEFKVRRDLELYGLTCNPEGFLQRVQ